MSSSISEDIIPKVEDDSISSINEKPLGTGIIYRKVDKHERAQVLSVQDTQPGVRSKGDWLRRSSRTVQLPKNPFTSVTPDSNTTITDATPRIAVSAVKRKSSPSPQKLDYSLPSDLVSSEELSLPTPPSTSGFRDGEAESSSKRIKVSSDDDGGKDSAVEDVNDEDFSPESIKVGATPEQGVSSQPHEDKTSSRVPPAQIKKKRQVRKIAVSEVSAQTVVSRRPRPQGQPAVWAEGRQDLCETLPWFRAFQSGAYTFSGRSPGFLLDKDCGLRPYIDGEIAITRAGGGCKRNAETGILEQTIDQDGSSIKITCFENHKILRIPIGLIAGSNNTAFPTELPHRYCVLDWFQVTDIWAERWGRVICFKIRFEKIELHCKSWWVPVGSEDPPLTRSFEMAATKASCTKCRKSSKQVFELGWMCLNDKCTEFWLLAGSEPPADMDYNPDFLAERTPWPKGVKPPYELKPKALEENTGNNPDYAVMHVCWKGIVCELCGRCNSRRLWRGWNCQTPGCMFFYEVKKSILSPRTILDAHEVEWAGHALPRDTTILPTIMSLPKFLGYWRIHTYALPSLDIAGTTSVITHYFSNKIINEAPGGPTDIFMRLQEIEVGLERFALKTSPLAGQMLTQHFAVNYGAPYKYIVDVDSKPFADADPVLLTALQRVSWAARQTIEATEIIDVAEIVEATEAAEIMGSTEIAVASKITEDAKLTGSVPAAKFTGFNEELIIGYFEDQKIDYHDDGESELGPTVATLSLGGGAIMYVRMKRKYYFGCKSENQYDHEAEVIPCSFAYEERKKLRESYGKVSDDVYQRQFQKIMRRIPKKGCAPPCLKMELGHGDMIVMHGEDMQKYYEHAITPIGKLRFGLTCRYVRPELIDAAHHWKGVFPDTAKDRYYGDLHLTNGSVGMNGDV